MKNKTRKIIINDETWVWIVSSGQFGNVEEVRIYSPDRKLFRIKAEDITSETKFVGLEGDLPFTVKPSHIKNYIEKKLLHIH